MRTLIRDGRTETVHDVSDGGIYVAVAEMCLAGGIGADIHPPGTASETAWLFGEDQGRYIVASHRPDAILDAAKAADLPAALIGRAGGADITIEGEDAVSLDDLRSLHEGWLPAYMRGEAAAQ